MEVEDEMMTTMAQLIATLVINRLPSVQKSICADAVTVINGASDPVGLLLMAGAMLRELDGLRKPCWTDTKTRKVLETCA